MVCIAEVAEWATGHFKLSGEFRERYSPQGKKAEAFILHLSLSFAEGYSY